MEISRGFIPRETGRWLQSHRFIRCWSGADDSAILLNNTKIGQNVWFPVRGINLQPGWELILQDPPSVNLRRRLHRQFYSCDRYFFHVLGIENQDVRTQTLFQVPRYAHEEPLAVARGVTPALSSTMIQIQTHVTSKPRDREGYARCALSGGDQRLTAQRWS
jgi:hypothetical protein